MKKLIMLVMVLSVSFVSSATVIDIVGSTVSGGGGEFADYSGIGSGNNVTGWPPSVVNDGAVSLTVGTDSLNGDVSISAFNMDSYRGAGTEINFNKQLGAISDTVADQAVAGNAFLSIIVDSTGLSDAAIQLNSVSLSMWRNGGAAAEYYQLAYSADSTWDTSDLLGSPTHITSSGTGGTFTIDTGDLSSIAALGTQAEVRVYFWGPNGINQANTHLYNVEADYVPEPATMLLLGLGGLVLRKRR